MLLSGKKVLIMGLGENGGGLLSAKFCLARGAEVLVSDLQSEEKLHKSTAELCNFAAEMAAEQRLHFCLGKHEFKDFQTADLVVKNPGVPKGSPYLKAAKAWTSDLALFLQIYPSVPILAITGTKGKSSIAHALHSILQQFLPKVMLAGNIGRSPLFYALQPEWQDTAPMVLELSSWQLGDLRETRAIFQPQMACISNIMQDHQDRYAKFSDYVADKFSIFHNLKSDGELLLGTGDGMFLKHTFWGDFAARAFAQNLAQNFAQNFGSAKQLHYFAERLNEGLRGIYWQGDGTCFIREKKDILFLEKAQFLGQHSFKNYCIASYMAYRFLRRSNLTDLATFCQKNAQHLAQYSGVPFRMEHRAMLKLQGKCLHFINDTAATMPEAAALALEACLENRENYCLLIAGGTDKQLDPSPLIESLQAKSDQVTPFFLAGNGTDALIARLKENDSSFSPQVFDSLQAAFSAALEYAETLEQQNIYLLLSPGYASFGMFQNEFDRGRQFNQLLSDINP